MLPEKLQYFRTVCLGQLGQGNSLMPRKERGRSVQEGSAEGCVMAEG